MMPMLKETEEMAKPQAISHGAYKRNTVKSEGKQLQKLKMNLNLLKLQQ